MTEESTATGRNARLDSIADDATLLMSDHPQELHERKLLEGIEELAPGSDRAAQDGRHPGAHPLARGPTVRRRRDGRTSSERRRGCGPRSRRAPRRDPARAERCRAHEVAQDPRPGVRAEEGGRARARASAQRANELIDGFVDRGEADAYVEWCDPLPSSIFLSIMGIPQSEREHFIVVQERDHPARPVRRRPTPTERETPPSPTARTWFAAEFDRRERSGDLRRRHHRLAAARPRSTGARITRDELHGICNLLMIAGLDTVAASLVVHPGPPRPSSRAPRQLLAEPDAVAERRSRSSCASSRR